MLSFFELIDKTVKMKASDLHLTVGLMPMARIDGKLMPIAEYRLQSDDIYGYCKEALDEKQLALLEERGELDFAYSAPQTGRFRINAFKQRGSYAIAARVVNMRIPSPEELALPQSLVEMCDKKRGLVLVTGATGSGKSTTLASLINVVNHKHNHHIITIEDPIEYLHRHDKSIINQREIGSDSLSFANALRGALRQDPDVILVGEMRDHDTISVAVTAAETGHLVFSTLHTIGAVNTIDRIIDVFEPAQQQQIRTQLADVLQCVVSQQLIPKIDGGRVAAFEVMLTNAAIRNNIRESKTFQIQSAIQTNQKLGMRTMDDAIFDLYEKKVISLENTIAYAQDRVAMRKRMMF